MAEGDGDIQQQRAEALARGKAIADVITEKQFQRGAAGFMDFFGLALNHHAGRDLGAALGNEFAIDLDEANLAGVEWAAFLQEAEGGDVERETARGGEDGFAGSDGDGRAVDGDGEGGHGAAKSEVQGSKSELRSPKSERNPKPEIRNPNWRLAVVMLISSILSRR
jgi:hypothetical protein